MSGFGLDTLVIDSDTSAEARVPNRNIWNDARTEGSVIILSPEELQNHEFRRTSLTTQNSLNTSANLVLTRFICFIGGESASVVNLKVVR